MYEGMSLEQMAARQKEHQANLGYVRTIPFHHLSSASRFHSPLRFCLFDHSSTPFPAQVPAPLVLMDEKDQVDVPPSIRRYRKTAHPNIPLHLLVSTYVLRGEALPFKNYTGFFTASFFFLFAGRHI